MFLSAARALADHVDEADLARGSVYPPLASIRDVSLDIAVAIAEEAYASDLADCERPADVREYIRSQMFDPSY